MATPKKETPGKLTPKVAKPTQVVTASVKSELPLAKPTRKEFQGTVASTKMMKTIVVKVDRHIKNALYKKYVLSSQKYMVHDEKNDAKVGDLVLIVETRPMSKNKRWGLKKVLRRATQSGAITQG